MSDRDDPSNMSSLIRRLELMMCTVEGLPFRHEVLAAVLRSRSFHYGRSVYYIRTVADPEVDCDWPVPSTPGQMNLVEFVARSEGDMHGVNDPPEMEALIEALQGLNLKDDEGFPFCREVLAVALRSARYVPSWAAEYLFGALDQQTDGGPSRPRAERHEAIRELIVRFPEPYWAVSQRQEYNEMGLCATPPTN